jgi:putative transposase
LLRDRDITVHHTTVMRWVHHYGPIFKGSMASASNSSR